MANTGGGDNDPGSVSITSACLNENDLNYQINIDGIYDPLATIHDQEACASDEEYIPDPTTIADEDIPVDDDADTVPVVPTSKNNYILPIAILGALFWL